MSKIGNVVAPGRVLQAEFHDFDQFAHSLVSWDVSLVQLEPGAFRGETSQVLLCDSMIMSCSMNRAVSQQGGLPPHARTIGIPLDGCTPFRWHGHEVGDDVMMIFPRNGELDSRSGAGFRVVTVSVREDLLEELAEREGDGGVLKGGGFVVRPAPEKLVKLRDMALGMLSRSNADREAVLQDKFRREVELELAKGALEALASGQGRCCRPMAAERGRVLRVALDLIEQRVHEPVQVSELVEQAGCSDRTLRYAFAEHFGVSPKNYLKARRLTELRRLLRVSDPRQTVAALATRMGFWNLGQLAGDYRRLFGELPSRTLSRGGGLS